LNKGSVVLERDVSNQMKQFLAWEKAIIVYSTVLAIVLTIVGLVLFPTMGPIMKSRIPTFFEIIRLGIGGWVGLVGIGTISNLLVSTIVSLRADH